MPLERQCILREHSKCTEALAASFKMIFEGKQLIYTCIESHLSATTAADEEEIHWHVLTKTISK